MSRLAAIALALAAVGCSYPTNDPGLDSLLRVPGAHYFRGAPPAVSPQGPVISQFTASSSVIHRETGALPLSGIVPRNTTSVLLYLQGDPGYWLVTPGAVDPQALGQLGFSATLQFSPLLPRGSFNVIGRAVDSAGRAGPPANQPVMTEDLPAKDTLVVSLKWDTESDLDLHLVIPDGTEIWSGKINSLPPPIPGQPMDPNAWMQGGVLDYDSNANCVIDGRRMENVYWTVAPPSGKYIARVDTASLCGEAQADWQLAVTLNGQSLGRAFGWSHDTDAQMPHGAGAGVTALTFDVP
jgi:hypothetical protein